MIFVNPTPFGILLLGGFHRDGEFELDAVCLDEPTSFEVFMAMMLGEQIEGLPSSYLAATTNPDPEADTGHLDRALRFLMVALGGGLGHSIAEFLEGHGATKATLISCGPISLAPLHAFAWEQEGEQVSLLDGFDLRDAPSATLQRTSLKQAQERADEPSTLAAIGNPDLGNPKLDLPAAEARGERNRRTLS